MIAFSPEAQQLFDRYLQSVRWSIRGAADAGEIEHSVREHVESALENQQQPVSSHTLRSVLSRLGDPWEWIPAEDLPLWRRLMMRFSLGPEDWRLAYSCFALTLLGFILLPLGVGGFFLIGAFLFARATLDLSSDREKFLGAQRWLICPPLVLVYLVLLVVLFVAPVGGVIAWCVDRHGFELVFHRSHFDVPFYAGAVSLIIGGWLLIASAIVALAVRPLRWIFKPFADRLRRAHAFWLTAIGAVAAGAGALLLWH